MEVCKIVDCCLNEIILFGSHSECLIRLYAKISGLHKVFSTNIDCDGVIEFIIEDYGD